MTSEMRRLSLCFLASLLVNAAAFVLMGWVWRSPSVPSAATFPRLQMVRLLWHPAAPPPVIVPVVPPPPQPAKPVLTRPRPVKPPRPKKLRRPGARVHSAQPASPAAPSGGQEAGAPAPAMAAPPAAPAPAVVTTQRAAPFVVHNVITPPLPALAPVAVSAPAPPPPVPAVAPPAAVTGRGGGGTASGSGAGAGVGTGAGAGAGSGPGRDVGEPFGIGKGMAGDGAPRHVVYVLDISGSMTSRIDRAEAELRTRAPRPAARRDVQHRGLQRRGPRVRHRHGTRDAGHGTESVRLPRYAPSGRRNEPGRGDGKGAGAAPT